MIFLLRNWKYVLTFLGTLAIVGAAFYIHLLRGDIKDLKGEVAGLEQYLEEAHAEVNQCVSDKAISERSSNDYQKSINSLRRQLNSLRDDPTCVPTESSIPPNGHNGAATGAIVSGRSGLRTGYLIDLGGRCEETRLKLIGCQKFINQTWESRNVKN